MNTDAPLDSVDYELRCPEVLELPDRMVQFYNLWPREFDDGPPQLSVTVSIADGQHFPVRAGDTFEVDDVVVTITELDDDPTHDIAVRCTVALADRTENP